MTDSRYLVPKQHSLLGAEVDYLLLDGSGSMIPKWSETLAALDAYRTRVGNLNSHAILHVFDGENMEYIQRDSLLSDWEPINRGTVDLPGGGSPIYDSINLAVRRLAELAPQKCTFVIATDGQDTGGDTDEHQAKALLDWCRAQGWQVIFIGADFNNSRQARALGASTEHYIGVQKGRLSEAMDALAEKRLRYSRTGDDIGFSGDEKTTFGGYLAGPSGK